MPSSSHASQYGYLDDDDSMLDSSPSVNEPNKDSKWAQQTVSAWNPVRSNACVVTLFIFVGILSLALGLVIINVFDTKVVEVEARYDTVCASGSTDGCHVDLIAPADMQPPIYLYYKLVDYYQNHRLYAQSRSDEQLHGSTSYDTTSCYPLSHVAVGDQRKRLYPCGLIANSYFNDTFKFQTCTGNSCSPANPVVDSIAWPTDLDKYHGRPLLDSETNKGPNGILKSPADQDLIVWLRVAAMSTFKKLKGVLMEPVRRGSLLRVEVSDQYKATNFEKWVVMATTSVMGGSQAFLANLCVGLGVLCIILAIIFLCLNRAQKPDHERYFVNPEADRAGTGD